MNGEERVDAPEKDFAGERAGKHGGDHFDGVRNLQSSQRIAGTVDDAHRGPALPEKASEAGTRHFGGMEFRDQKIDWSSARLGQLQSLHGIGGYKNEKVRTFEDVLNVPLKKL